MKLAPMRMYKDTLYGQMLNRRKLEKVIAYVESHDQALQGDKTFIMHLINEKSKDVNKYGQM